MLLAFWIGIYPKPLFRVLDVPVRQIVEQVNPGYYNSATAQRWGEKPPLALAKQGPGLNANTQGAGETKAEKPASSAGPVIVASSAPMAANRVEKR